MSLLSDGIGGGISPPPLLSKVLEELPAVPHMPPPLLLNAKPIPPTPTLLLPLEEENEEMGGKLASCLVEDDPRQE